MTSSYFPEEDDDDDVEQQNLIPDDGLTDGRTPVRYPME